MENAFGMFPGFEPDEWSNDACRGYNQRQGLSLQG